MRAHAHTHSQHMFKKDAPLRQRASSFSRSYSDPAQMTLTRSRVQRMGMPHHSLGPDSGPSQWPLPRRLAQSQARLRGRGFRVGLG